MQPSSKEESRRNHQRRKQQEHWNTLEAVTPTQESSATQCFSSRLSSQAAVIWLDSAVRSRAWIQRRYLMLMRLILQREKRRRYRDPLKLDVKKQLHHTTPRKTDMEPWNSHQNWIGGFGCLKWATYGFPRQSSGGGQAWLVQIIRLGGFAGWAKLKLTPSYVMCKFRRHKGQVALRCNLSW